MANYSYDDHSLRRRASLFDFPRGAAIPIRPVLLHHRENDLERRREDGEHILVCTATRYAKLLRNLDHNIPASDKPHDPSLAANLLAAPNTFLHESRKEGDRV